MASPVGLIANHFHVALLPIYLLAILVLMAATHEKLPKRAAASDALR